MSGDCGHGWGYHHDGPSGPCYRCRELEEEELEKAKEIYKEGFDTAGSHVIKFEDHWENSNTYVKIRKRYDI